MRVVKFCFKFWDHEDKVLHLIEVCVYCLRIIKWPSNENDRVRYDEWLEEHAKWEHDLKMIVKEIVQNRHPELLRGIGEHWFGDYRIIKTKISEECNIVNMNAANGIAQPEFREIDGMKKTKMEFERASGRRPQNWPKIYDYKKTTNHYYFDVGEGENPQHVASKQGSHLKFPNGNPTSSTALTRQEQLMKRKKNVSRLGQGRPVQRNPRQEGDPIRPARSNVVIWQEAPN